MDYSSLQDLAAVEEGAEAGRGIFRAWGQRPRMTGPAKGAAGLDKELSLGELKVEFDGVSEGYKGIVANVTPLGPSA